jgi:hypothetical protein
MLKSPSVTRLAPAIAAAAILGLAAGPSLAYDLKYQKPRWQNPGSIGTVSCYYQCHVARGSGTPNLYKVCVSNFTGNQVSVTWVGSKC